MRLRRALTGAVLAATAAVAALPADASAQAGCRISSVRMYSHYSSANREHYIIFRPAIQCTRTTSWKVTLTIRRRRLGPDATVASRQYRGRGSRAFILGAGCKNGNRFNGDIWLNVQPGGPTLHAVKKNVEC